MESGDPKVLEMLRRMVATANGKPDMDLEQEAFLKVLEAFRRHRDIRRPEALIRKIVRDTVIDSWRARARIAATGIAEVLERCPSQTPHVEEEVDRREKLHILHESILELGCDIRGPVYLFYIERYPIRSIAEVLGKSRSAIKMALHRGRRQLGKISESPRTTKKMIRQNAKS